MEGKRVKRIPDEFIAKKSCRYECVLVAEKGDDTVVLRREGLGLIEMVVTVGGNSYVLEPESSLLDLFYDGERFERICYDGVIGEDEVRVWICLRKEERDIWIHSHGKKLMTA